MNRFLTLSPPIPRSIWALGIVSLLMKTSAVLIFILSPLLITKVLGGSAFIVGLMEGFTEAFSLFTRIFAGVISDYLHKRKAIIVFGYILSLISRPFLALAASLEGVFIGRALDRIGNGLDATPRDALVGDLAPPKIKGACYGLRESLARVGSFLGAILAIGLLWLTSDDYALVFWIGSIPVAIALLVLLYYVKDPLREKYEHIKRGHKFKLKDIKHLRLAYWLTLLLSGLFMLSNFSGAFLILRTEQTGLPLYLIPLVMVVQNTATALTAFPVGFLSDKMGRRSMMALGIGLVILADLILAAGTTPWIVLCGIFLWGAEMGVTQSILAILIADSCPQDVRGTGFGLFHFLNGICLIFANSLAGWVWDAAGPTQMFYTSALIALFSAVVLPFIHNKK